MPYFVFGLGSSFDSSTSQLEFQKIGECVSDEFDSELFLNMMRVLQSIEDDYTVVLFQFESVGDIIEAEINAEVNKEEVMVNFPPTTLLRIKRIGNNVTFYPTKEWLPNFKSILMDANLEHDFTPHNGDFEW